MQHFKLLCMSPLLQQLFITICTTVWKSFNISLVVEMLTYSKKCFRISQNKNYSSICKCIIITSPIGFNIVLTNVHARLKQCCNNVVPTLCNVVSTLCNVVSTLCNTENPTSDFGSFSTSDNVISISTTLQQCWSDVEILAGNDITNILDINIFQSNVIK